LLIKDLFQNQGSFFITGNWQNTNVYQGTGSVTLNGDADQKFHNNKNAVYNLEINGTGTKFILDKLPITNRLDLTQGIVNITDNDTLLIANGASIGGGSTVSYVDGALTHSGVGYKFFPIGKNGGYYPLEMLNINGINPTTEVEVFEISQRANTLPSSITLFSNIYWQRKTICRNICELSPISWITHTDDYTNRHVVDILQADAPDKEFTFSGNTRVGVQRSDLARDKRQCSTINIFVLGESIPVDGVPGEFISQHRYHRGYE
jgi:hypothetical protein